MKARRQTSEKPDEAGKSSSAETNDTESEVPDKYKMQQKVVNEEGNVTNSLAMLTAIPEVDLGME